MFKPSAERLEQVAGGLGDSQNRQLHQILGGDGRLLHAADLAHVLTGGGLDLLVGRHGLEAPEGGDVAAHGRDATDLPDGDGHRTAQPTDTQMSPGRAATQVTVKGTVIPFS